MTATLPFTVIGGYLGAGKTTLLNHLLTQTRGQRMAVLVNDFGSVNIDASLIRDHDGDTINLANGCLCCSLVNGFASAIAHILERADDFDRLVIEASGVADPGKIAQYGQMYELPLDGILVLVDAEQIRAQVDNVYVGDTVLRQLEQADLLIVNKCDLVSDAQRQEVRYWLSERAPGTPILETRYSEAPHEILFGHAQPTSAFMPASVRLDHGDAFQSWTLEKRDPVSRTAIERFAANLGEEIYRVKGFVYLREDPARCYVYQQVGSRWSLEPGPIWKPVTAQTTLVMIGRRQDDWKPDVVEITA